MKEDATQSVRAVTSRGYYNEYTTRYTNYDPVSGIRRIADGSEAGTIDMFQGTATDFALFKGFKRLTNVGDSGTVTTKLCEGGISNGVCSVALKDLTWFYTFVGASEAETELTFDAVPPTPPESTP